MAAAAFTTTVVVAAPNKVPTSLTCSPAAAVAHVVFVAVCLLAYSLHLTVRVLLLLQSWALSRTQ